MVMELQRSIYCFQVFHDQYSNVIIADAIGILRDEKRTRSSHLLEGNSKNHCRIMRPVPAVCLHIGEEGNCPQFPIVYIQCTHFFLMDAKKGFALILAQRDY